MKRGNHLLSPFLTVALIAAGCSANGPESVKPGAARACELPARAPNAVGSIGPLVLGSDAQGRYASVPTPSKAAKDMASDVLARVENGRAKTQAAGVVVGERMLVASGVILDGAADVTDLTVRGSSRSAAVRNVCTIPEYGLVKIEFGRTVAQGNQYIGLSREQAQPGDPILAAAKRGDDVTVVGGVLLRSDSIVTGVDATSMGADGKNMSVDDSWAVGAVMNGGGSHLQGLITTERHAPLSSDDQRALNVQLDPTNTAVPTQNSILGYDATWRVVHATMPE